MIVSIAKRLDSINEYYFSKKLKEIAAMNAAGHQVINLGIGSPDLPPHPDTVAALVDSAQLPSSHAYQGYVGIPALREAFAGFYQKHYGVTLHPQTDILPLLGSKEGIMHVCMTFLEPGTVALVPNPGYPTYRAAVTLAGAEVRDYPLDAEHHWLPDLDALAAQDLSSVRLMFVNYPHMPTGALADKAFFKRLIAFAKEHNILIINDNPYSFILNDHPLSILSVDGAEAVALELNSLSKSHNMAGWRVGALVGRADYLEAVLRFKSNMDSGMFLPVQLAAVAALKADTAWYNDLNDIYRQRQLKAFDLLSYLGCEFDRQQSGMFVWAKIPPQYDTAYALSDKILHEAKVFLTPGGIFGHKGDAYIRISLCAESRVFDTAFERIQNRNITA